MKKYIQFSFIFGFLVLIGLPSAAVMQEAEELPLSTRGNYHVGQRKLTFVDEQRDGREIEVTIWYPATVPEDLQDKVEVSEAKNKPLKDLAPDVSGDSYSIVLFSHGYTDYVVRWRKLLYPLVSHGFVVAGVQHRNDKSSLSFIDRPLDILFAIDQLSALNADTDSELAGMMNADQIGVMGWGFGSYTALAVGGASIDTEAIDQYVELVGGIDSIRAWHPDWDWTMIEAYHDQLMPPQAEDPLWPAMTDPRIRAVIPYMVCDVHMFGERGLAVATVPTLLIAGTRDTSCPYDQEAVTAYTHLGSAEHSLLTLVDVDHSYPSESTQKVVQHYVTAFFGYHLQGKTEYADYLTEEYAESLDNVVWGPYESE
jgi:predicted dienelactone hydrolase